MSDQARWLEEDEGYLGLRAASASAFRPLLYNARIHDVCVCVRAWQVLYHARIHFGVAKGLKEVCQALERGEAQLVIMAEDCDHEGIVSLVTALTADKGVYLIKVPEKAKLGDWAGAPPHVSISRTKSPQP